MIYGKEWLYLIGSNNQFTQRYYYSVKFGGFNMGMFAMTGQ